MMSFAVTDATVQYDGPGVELAFPHLDQSDPLLLLQLQHRYTAVCLALKQTLRYTPCFMDLSPFKAGVSNPGLRTSALCLRRTLWSGSLLIADYLDQARSVNHKYLPLSWYLNLKFLLFAYLLFTYTFQWHFIVDNKFYHLKHRLRISVSYSTD